VKAIKVLLGFKVRNVRTVREGEIVFYKKAVPVRDRFFTAWEVLKKNTHVNDLPTLYSMQVLMTPEQRMIGAQLHEGAKG